MNRQRLRTEELTPIQSLVGHRRTTIDYLCSVYEEGKEGLLLPPTIQRYDGMNVLLEGYHRTCFKELFVGYDDYHVMMHEQDLICPEDVSWIPPEAVAEQNRLARKNYDDHGLALAVTRGWQIFTIADLIRKSGLHAQPRIARLVQQRGRPEWKVAA